VWDQTVTVAAIDRLVHHATILELNVESYRRRSAEKAKEKNSKRRLATTTDDN
jgi:DNA replication protein DnaC